jgi:hypothetical protein
MKQYSTTLRKIRGSHSVSNFEEIIFLKFFDINFQNFGFSSLAEKKLLKSYFLNSLVKTTSENIFFLNGFYFKNGSFWGLKMTSMGIFSQNPFFFKF